MGTLGAAHKIPIDFCAPDIFKFYNDTYGNKLELSQKTFNSFTKEFFDRVTTLMIDENMEFIFPKRMGILRLIKYKVKLKLYEDGRLDKRQLRPDWCSTKALWKRLYSTSTWEEITAMKGKPMVYHENKHTDGYNVRWKWDKAICLVPNKSAYSFDMARRIDRKLASFLKDDTKDTNFYMQ